MIPWRRSTFAFLGIALACAASASAEELRYVAKSNRRASLEASLAASLDIRLSENWQLLGPFPAPEGRGLELSYPPEHAIDLTAIYDGAGGSIRWQEARLPDGKVHNLKRLPFTQDVVCYLYRRLDCDRPSRLRVSLGFDDDLAVFVNGSQLATFRGGEAATPDQRFLQVPLRAGENHLLLKLANREGDWKFYFQPTLSAGLLVQLDERLDADFPPQGEAAYYRSIPIPLPENEVVEVGALAFRPDGKLYVASRRGDVWLLSNPLAGDVEQISARRFATGLHEVLGLAVSGEHEILVGQRPEVTRLIDTDGDDVADEYLTVSDRFGISGDYHEFLYGPVRGLGDSLFIALNLSLGGQSFARVPYRGCVLQIDHRGQLTPFAYGLRSPNGLGFSPDGQLYCTDNQGEWVPACKLQALRAGDFCGHVSSTRWWPGGKDGDRPDWVRPAAWLPFGTCRSATQPVWDETAGRFGPFAEQCFVGELTNSLILRVMLENVAGRPQGACILFRKGFTCGVNRLAFAPDGSLFVGQTNRGWGSLGGRTQGLDRLVFRGRVPFELQTLRVTAGGWDLGFTLPVDPMRAVELKNYFIESFTFHYWDTYGSPETDRRPSPVARVTLSDDGRTVHLDVPDRPIDRVYRFRIDNLQSATGQPLLHREAYYTLNALP